MFWWNSFKLRCNLKRIYFRFASSAQQRRLLPFLSNVIVRLKIVEYPQNITDCIDIWDSIMTLVCCISSLKCILNLNCIADHIKQKWQENLLVSSTTWIGCTSSEIWKLCTICEVEILIELIAIVPGIVIIICKGFWCKLKWIVPAVLPNHSDVEVI